MKRTGRFKECNKLSLSIQQPEAVKRMVIADFKHGVHAVSNAYQVDFQQSLSPFIPTGKCTLILADTVYFTIPAPRCESIPYLFM